MISGRIRYRSRQFWEMLRGCSVSVDMAQVQYILGPALTEVFLKMHPAEQAHSFQVYRALVGAGETNSDLHVAALLHDAGKSKSPLSIWERVAVVIARRFSPGTVRKLGQDRAVAHSIPKNGIRHAFLVAEQHPEWGAELAAEAGASALACTLIRRHQDFLPDGDRDAGESFVNGLLRKLQSVDDNS